MVNGFFQLCAGIGKELYLEIRVGEAVIPGKLVDLECEVVIFHDLCNIALGALR